MDCPQVQVSARRTCISPLSAIPVENFLQLYIETELMALKHQGS